MLKWGLVTMMGTHGQTGEKQPAPITAFDKNRNHCRTQQVHVLKPSLCWAICQYFFTNLSHIFCFCFSLEQRQSLKAKQVGEHHTTMEPVESAIPSSPRPMSLRSHTLFKMTLNGRDLIAIENIKGIWLKTCSSGSKVVRFLQTASQQLVIFKLLSGLMSVLRSCEEGTGPCILSSLTDAIIACVASACA